MTPERRVLFALAAVEVRRLLRSPSIIAGAAASVYLVWRWTSRWAPVWPETSAWLAGALLPLGAASWFVASWLAARDRRNATRDIVEALPTSERVREAAFLLAGVGPFTVAVAILLMGAVFVAPDAVGTPAWWELAGGPVMVAFAWVGGFVLGRFSSLLSVLAFPVLTHWTLVASPDIEIGATAETGRLGLAALAPWIPPSLFEPAEQTLLRPSALHTTFLILITLGAAVWFLLRHERRLWALAAMAVVLTLTVLTARRLVAAPTPLWNWEEVTRAQPCEEREDVTYCFYPLYRPWVDDWADTVRAVAAVAPIDLTAVVQQPGNEVFAGPYAGRTGVVAAPIRWDRRGQPPRHRFTLAAAIAGTAVGLDPQPCSAAGQARLVFVLWAASVASHDGGSVVGDPNLVRELLGFWRPDEASIGLAASLTARDADEVADVFRLHAGKLRNPDTSTGDVAAWFDMEAPSPSDTAETGLSGTCR